MPRLPMPYQVIEDLENALCAYTGAPHALAVSSCTAALEIICSFLRVREVTIPRRTYASVPQAIVKAGGTVEFDDRIWRGAYQLGSTQIWDCAPRFTTGMYVKGTYQCLSFHRRKILGHTEGGAILFDSSDSLETLREMRHDGRPVGSPMPVRIGYHAVMHPGVAAELLAKAQIWDRPHDDMSCDDYPDLSTIPWNKLYAIDQERPQAASSEILEALGKVRALRKDNNDNWMDLLEYVAKTNPEYFRTWQKRTRNIDILVSEQMRKTVEEPRFRDMPV